MYIKKNFTKSIFKLGKKALKAFIIAGQNLFKEQRTLTMDHQQM
jgi:hypothetical protein